MSQEYDKNCQFTKYYEPNKEQIKLKCSDKKCQENENIDMLPVKPKKDVQLKKPAMKLIGLAKDKNCHATMSHKKQNKCEYKESKSQSAVKYACSDKNCQENREPRSDMWSVTNTDNVWLPKPAVPYGYSRLCKKKDCQSTRCYKKRVMTKTVSNEE